MNIRTEFVYPPIPDRRFDFRAVDYDTYDPDPECHGLGSIVGWGATEAEAIADYKEQRADYDEEHSS